MLPSQQFVAHQRKCLWHQLLWTVDANFQISCPNNFYSHPFVMDNWLFDSQYQLSAKLKWPTRIIDRLSVHILSAWMFYPNKSGTQGLPFFLWICAAQLANSWPRWMECTSSPVASRALATQSVGVTISSDENWVVLVICGMCFQFAIVRYMGCKISNLSMWLY